MIDTKELRRLAQAATAGPDGVSLSWIRLLQDFQQGASPAAVSELLDRLDDAERVRDALRAENETLAANLRGKHNTAGATYAHLIAERDALRTKIEEMEKQEPFDADSDVFRSAFESALKAGNWPMTRQGDGYRSPSTQIAWRIAFSTVNRMKLYARPGAKGEIK